MIMASRILTYFLAIIFPILYGIYNSCTWISTTHFSLGKFLRMYVKFKKQNTKYGDFFYL